MRSMQQYKDIRDNYQVEYGRHSFEQAMSVVFILIVIASFLHSEAAAIWGAQEESHKAQARLGRTIGYPSYTILDRLYHLIKPIRLSLVRLTNVATDRALLGNSPNLYDIAHAEI